MDDNIPLICLMYTAPSLFIYVIYVCISCLILWPVAYVHLHYTLYLFREATAHALLVCNALLSNTRDNKVEALNVNLGSHSYSKMGHAVLFP